MKKYKRIEITAFRRRVLIVSGEPTAEAGEVGVSVNDSDSQESIETGSDEGQEILLQAIRLLHETIAGPANSETASSNSPKEIDFGANAINKEIRR